MMKIVHILCVTMLFCMAFICAQNGNNNAWAQDKNNAPIIIAPADLILQVKRNSVQGDTILSDAIFAQERSGQYFLPVSELGLLLGLTVDIDFKRQTISGWYFTEDKTYFVNIKDGIYESAQNSGRFLADQIIVDSPSAGFGEVFIDIALLNQIWPLQMDVEYAALRLNINTPYTLPFEAKNARRKRQASLLSRGDDVADDNRAGLTRIDNPYGLYSLPVMQLEMDQGWSENNQTFRSNYRLNGRNDLLGFSADYNVNFRGINNRIDLPDAVRLTLQRKDWGHSPMPFGIKQIRLGDTSIRPSSLAAGSRSGRGIFVSSRPVDRGTNFDVITIEGSGTSGWDVELFQNDQLIAFGVIDETGEYRFDNIDLFFGLNIFRIVLYGPQGQIEERIERYNINGSLLKPGEFFYEGGIVDAEQDFIEIQDQDNSATTRAGLSHSAYAALGLNRFMTLFATSTTVETTNEQKSYLSGGMNYTSPIGLGSIEYLKDIGGGTALDMRFATDLLGWRFNLGGSLYQNFESERAGFNLARKNHEVDMRAGRSFSLNGNPLSLQFLLDHENFVTQDARTTYQARQAYGWSGFRISNSTRMIRQNNTETQVNGTLSTNLNFLRKWSLRSNFQYRLKPETIEDNISATLRYRSNQKWSLSASADQNLQSDTTILGLQASYDFDHFIGSFDTDWSKGNGTSVLLRLSTSLAPYGIDGDYIARSRDLRSAAAVRAQLFEDKNGNDIFDDKDTPLNDETVFIDGYSSLEKSDRRGILSDFNRGSGGYRTIEYDTANADNPYFRSTVAGYDALLRPASIVDVDFPIIETGSIDGTAYDAGGQPLSRLKLELVNTENIAIDETITAYDGFYVFEYVPPGIYRVRQKDNDPKSSTFIPPQIVAVTSDALYAYGIDLQLPERQPPEQAADDIAMSETGNDAFESPADDEIAQLSHHTSAAPKAANTVSDSIAIDDNRIKQSAPLISAPVVPAPVPRLKPAQIGTADASTFIKAARLGRLGKMVRVTLDVSGPVTYQVTGSQGGKVLALTISDTRWNAGASWFPDSDLFEGFDIQSTRSSEPANHDQTIVLKLYGFGPVILVDHRAIPATVEHPYHRIEIDVLPEN